MRSSACDTLTRLCVRHVLCWSAFPLVPALGSPGSAAVGAAVDCSIAGSALFAGFTATMAGSDFAEPIDKGREAGGRRRTEKSDRRHCFLNRLLRARRERPRSGHAAEKSDELAPLHLIK